MLSISPCAYWPSVTWCVWDVFAFGRCFWTVLHVSAQSQLLQNQSEDPSLGREFIPHSLETSLLWQSFLTGAAEQMSHWGFDRTSSPWAPPSPQAPQKEFWIPTSLLQPLPIAFCTLKAFSIVCPLLLYFVSPLLLHINDMFLKIRVISHSSLYPSNCHAWNKCVLNIFFMTDKYSEFWKLLHIFCVLFKVSICCCWFHGWTKVSITGNSDACTR